MFGTLGGLTAKEELCGTVRGYTVGVSLSEVDYLEGV
jgi:hypothetical protein